MLGTECEDFRVMMRRVTDEPAESPHRRLHPDMLRDLVLHPSACASCLAWAQGCVAERSGPEGPPPELVAALDELSALETYWRWKDATVPEPDDLCAVWRDLMRRFGQPGVVERALEMKTVLGPHYFDCDLCGTIEPDPDAHADADTDALLDFVLELMIATIVDGLEDDGDEATRRVID